MQKFERITVDRGQALIRDTGISVSEIVSRTSDSQQLQNLVQEYPDLSPEDIQEALAYAVKDLIYAIAFWKNEGLTPLTSIKGYSELLLQKWSYAEITDEIRNQFMQGLHDNSWRAVAAWRHLRE